MLSKENVLFTILSLLSILTGAVFGLLDIFGFIDGRHAISISLLVGGIVLIYLTLITVFLLNFSTSNQARIVFIIAPILAGTTFYLMNLDLIQSIIVAVTYLLFIYYIYFASRERSRLFIKFSPKEIFFPILRQSFTFLLIILALTAYFQTQKLVQERHLASPAIIQFVSKPFILIINKQFTGELQKHFNKAPLTDEQKVVVAQTALQQTLLAMSEQKAGKDEVFGIPIELIPIQLASVQPNGSIDVTPVVEAMLPLIVEEVNNRINQYAIFTPFVIALFIILFLQPLLYPIQFIESLITLAIFKMLVATKFIKIHTSQSQIENITL